MVVELLVMVMEVLVMVVDLLEVGQYEGLL
jgi:hypothetical protein